MPNHVSTVLKINGPIDEIKLFVGAVDKGDDKGHFEFGGLLPMPEELRDTSSPIRIQTQEEIDAIWKDWREKKKNKEDSGPMGINSLESDRPWGLGITQEKYEKLISKYGHADWYSWCLANYGTKWGAYDASEWTVNGNEATISYSTAWSPASEFFQNVTNKFPNLVFTTEYADEGGGFVCCTVYQNGAIISDDCFYWKSEKGIEIRKKVGYWYEDSDDSEITEDDTKY